MKDKTQRLEQAKEGLEKGKVLMKEGKYADAIEVFEQVAPVFEEVENWESYVDCLNEWCMSLQGNGKFNLALEMGEKALSIGNVKLDKLSSIIANSFNNLGSVKWKMSDYQKAVHYHNKSLKIRFKTLGENHLSTASSFNNLGNVYKYMGDYKKAADYYNKSLKIRLNILGENHLKTANSFNNLGIVYCNIGDYKKAVHYYQKSTQIKLKNLGENHLSIADAYHNLGIVYMYMGGYKKAINYYYNSMEIRSNNLEENHPDMSNNFNVLGIVYYRMGNYKKASYYFNNSLKIRLIALGESHIDTANSYHNLGAIFMDIGDYKKGKDFYYKSLMIRLKILGENHPDTTYSYLNLGIVYWRMSNYQKAAYYYDKCLKIQLEILGENHPNTATSFLNLGVVYMDMGNYKKAVDYCYKSLKIRLKVLGENHPSIAGNFNNLSNMHRCMGNYKKAVDYCYKSLTISLNTLGENHPDTAQDYMNLGNIFSNQKNYKTAFEYYQLALQSLFPNFNETNYYQNPTLPNCLSKPILLKILQSKAHTFLQYYIHKTQNPKDLQAALSTYHLATKLITEMRQGYKAEGSKLILAEKGTPIFDGVIETALLSAKSENPPINREQLERVFTYSEQSKAILLLTGIKDTEAKASANIPQTLLQKEYDLRIELTYIDKRIQQEELKRTKKDETQIREWQSQHFDYQQEYDQLIEQFEKDYPEYYELKYQLETASVKDIQNYLSVKIPPLKGVRGMFGRREANITTIISYHLTPQKIYIFQITSNDYQVHEIDKPDNFSQLLEDFQEAIVYADIEAYLQAASTLFDLLLLPVLQQYPLKERGKLTIIPHDVLAALPFDALIDSRQLEGKGIREEEESLLRDFSVLPYVIKNFDISYHYSATLLLNSAKRQAKTAMQSASFIGFAPVNFDGKWEEKGESTELALASHRGKTKVLRSNRAGQTAMDNLPNTESEVKEVFQLFEQQQLDAKAFLYASANKQNLMENVAQHKYVLIATHGYVQDGNAGLSGIYLAKGQETETRIQETDVREEESKVKTIETHRHMNTQTPKYTNTNYILHTSEAYHLQLNADLVVLSSCSSGVGKLARGEGMMAINRGFLYAGASNIIFTHFDVPDDSSGELVKTLFQHILKEESYATALRKAKIALLSDSLKTPEDWAGYALIGG